MDTISSTYAPFEQEDTTENSPIPEIEPVLEEAADADAETTPEAAEEEVAEVEEVKNVDNISSFLKKYWYFIAALIALLVAFFKDSIF